MTDTGRIKMEAFQGVLYCEAYMDDEFSIEDLESMRAEIRAHYNGRTDVILRKVGAYSVALKTQLVLSNCIDEFRHFAYVVDNDVKRASAKFAATSYMQPYNTQIASSREEAFAMLQALVGGN